MQDERYSIRAKLQDFLGDDASKTFDTLVDSIQAKNQHDPDGVASLLASWEEILSVKKIKKTFSSEYEQSVIDMYVDVANTLTALEELCTIAKSLSLCPTKTVRNMAPWQQIAAHAFHLSNELDRSIEKMEKLDVSED